MKVLFLIAMVQVPFSLIGLIVFIKGIVESERTRRETTRRLITRGARIRLGVDK